MTGIEAPLPRSKSWPAFRHLAALALSLPATACGPGWKTVAIPGPESFPPRQQVQLWAGSTATRLHAVVITRDSVSGVPYLQSVECDSCRVQFPRAGIDSVRVGNPPAGFWRTFGLVMLGLLVVGVVTCATASECSSD